MAGADVSRQAINQRLNRMHEKGLVGKKKAGARAVGWWATVAPRLDPAVRTDIEAADIEDAVPLDELDG
jgi:hypothetical protein